MLRRPEAVERLTGALAGADRVVLLGDTLELRERPMAALLGIVRPVFERLAPVLAGKPVTLVPGNHDHQLGQPWLARAQVAGRPLGSENEWPVTEADGAAGVFASWLPGSEVTLAYPGLRLEGPGPPQHVRVVQRSQVEIRDDGGRHPRDGGSRR